jgi:hypothetical protein
MRDKASRCKARGGVTRHLSKARRGHAKLLGRQGDAKLGEARKGTYVRARRVKAPRPGKARRGKAPKPGAWVRRGEAIQST